jgi:hypothetical protein
MNKIMIDILTGLSFDTKGGNLQTKRYSKKTQKKAKISKSATLSKRRRN